MLTSFPAHAGARRQMKAENRMIGGDLRDCVFVGNQVAGAGQDRWAINAGPEPVTSLSRDATCSLGPGIADLASKHWNNGWANRATRCQLANLPTRYRQQPR